MCAHIVLAEDDEHQVTLDATIVDRFAGEPCFGHVRLSHCERSEVASLAAVRL